MMNRKTLMVSVVALGLAGLMMAQTPPPNPRTPPTPPAPSQPKPQGAEQEIRARSEVFAAAWNRHDFKAKAAFWAMDGDLIDPWGVNVKGRPALEKFFQDQHATVFKQSRYQIAKIATRSVKPDVAVVDWDATISGMTTPEGSEQPPLLHHVTLVMTKEANEWMFVAVRPVVYQQREGAPPVKPSGTMR